MRFGDYYPALYLYCYLPLQSRKKSEEDYDESDLDLENEIKPIGAYVKDREALLDQLFHCVKDASLDRNLPDVLKVGATS